MKIILLIFISFALFAQKSVTFKAGNIGLHLYQVKIASENKSLWISIHSNTNIDNPFGSYVDCKVSLRERKKK